MPIQPKFALSQDNDYVYVRINVPHIRVTNTELIAESNNFTFYCQPYLLKLTFPGEIDGEHENCKAIYNVDDEDGVVIANLPKKIPGEHFNDLDMTSKLLTKLSKQNEKITIPSIDVISSTTNDDIDIDIDDHDISNESDMMVSSVLKIYPTYGFNNKYSNILGKLVRDNFIGLFELLEPDKVNNNLRRELRIAKENELFDPSRYLGDYFDGINDDIYINSLEFKPNIQFTSQNIEQLSQFKNREYLLNDKEVNNLLLGLVDIIYAYLYNCRINNGDIEVIGNNEIAFNITKISSLFSWCDTYDNDSVYNVLVSVTRRSIIYPYLRRWDLTMLVLNDLLNIFTLGKKILLSCLLHIYKIFEYGHSYYILNKLYVIDYITWIQNLKTETLEKFVLELKNNIDLFTLTGKNDCCFKLNELEDWANRVIHNEDDEESDDDTNNSNEIPSQFYQFNLTDNILLKNNQKNNNGELEILLQKLHI